jgi:small nuclear ribonucleoprotein (snRNP)-like protein
MAKSGAHYNPFQVHDARGGHDGSATESVRRLLGKRLGALLVDDARQIIGTFAAFDKTANLAMTDAVEVDSRGRTKQLGTALVPLAMIQQLEHRPEVRSSPR